MKGVSFRNLLHYKPNIGYQHFFNAYHTSVVCNRLPNSGKRIYHAVSLIVNDSVRVFCQKEKVMPERFSMEIRDLVRQSLVFILYFKIVFFLYLAKHILINIKSGKTICLIQHFILFV